MRKLRLVLTVGMLLGVLAGWGAVEQARKNNPCECADANHLLDLVTCEIDPNAIPERWRIEDFALTPLEDEADQLLYRHIVAGELKRYNEPVLRDFIVRNVVVVRSIRADGISIAGTNASGSIWIATESASGTRFSEWWIRHTVHHEIGMLVYFSAGGDFPRDEWIGGGSDSPYRFENDPVAAIKAGVADKLDLKLAQDGFLTEFAQTTLYEDIAIVHSWLMMSPALTCFLAEQYPALGRKLEIWQRFIEDLNLLAPCR